MIAKLQQGFDVQNTNLMVLKGIGDEKDIDTLAIQKRRSQFRNDVNEINKFISFELSKLVGDSDFVFNLEEKNWENVRKYIVPLTFDLYMAREQVKNKQKITKVPSPNKTPSPDKSSPIQEESQLAELGENILFSETILKTIPDFGEVTKPETTKLSISTLASRAQLLIQKMT